LTGPRKRALVRFVSAVGIAKFSVVLRAEKAKQCGHSFMTAGRELKTYRIVAHSRAKDLSQKAKPNG
jgi:hypothetical protein